MKSLSRALLGAVLAGGLVFGGGIAANATVTLSLIHI